MFELYAKTRTAIPADQTGRRDSAIEYGLRPEVQVREGKSSSLVRLVTEPKTGYETFRVSDRSLGLTLLDFWRWSLSDLVSNATRGRLAEFIVANALAISTNSVRDEWSAYDLQTPEGVRVEVKSAAYIQTWYQSSLSKISFRTPKTRAYDPNTNQLDDDAKRQADVYVFAVLAHRDKGTIDPLNVDQWEFYVLLTATLDARTRSQYGITLPTLRKLSGGPVTYAELGAEVKRAADSRTVKP
jgi:hypothetical protein